MASNGLGPEPESTGTNLMSHKPIFSLGAEAMRVELDKKSLFALASDTRLEILKALQPMRRTVSQLSEALDIDKAAIHRHLKKMEDGGLVVRNEDHGFVYYGLSWKARDLMSPNENTRIVILISAMFVFSILASFFLLVGLGATDTVPMLDPRSPTGGEYMGSEDQNAFYQLAEDSPSTWMLPLLGFTAIAIVASVIALRKLYRPRQRIDPKVESSTVERPLPED
ncbi:MAG: winged helix-turn-helix transcriptional regulator [Candidatus Thermoplasmatota archaeon]|nr:winged helix-turn-helix transcriptional regulator [Candidatus Thermoplasmatota archaeon]